MADKTDKVPENVAGAYYVDRTCIDCDMCRQLAEHHFSRFVDGGYSMVFRQPVTPDEIANCEEALDHCPVEAIGNDGNS